MKKTKTRLMVNTASYMVNELVTVAYGFIIPRLIITAYGSEMNGWLRSIVNLLSFISICEFGIGNVIKANLYKPLLKKDSDRISSIIDSANRFFYKVGLIFLFYTIALIFLYPVFKSNVFGFKANTQMILVVSIGTFSRYFFGISSQLLLEADQRGYVVSITATVASIIVTIVSAILIKLDYSLLTVRILYAVVFSAKPLFLFFYARKRYNIVALKEPAKEEPLAQKWNGFAHHISRIVQNNTDTTVLTALSVIGNVSIYSVYHMVTNGISVMVNIFAKTITPVFGRMLASDDTRALRHNFDRFEWLMHCMISSVFSTCAVEIVHFVCIYTRGVTDVDYDLPLFGVLLTIATALTCLCQVYLSLIYSAGRFKETQMYIIFEPVINIVLSVIAVKNYGIVGVTAGTIVSVLYTMAFLIIFLRKRIINKSIASYWRIFALDLIVVLSIVVFSRLITVSASTYYLLLGRAAIIGLIGVATAGIVSFALFRSNLIWMIKEARGFLLKLLAPRKA